MRKILACILFLYSVVVFSADAMKMQVSLRCQTFDVMLPANPTTGYQWAIKQYDKTLFKLTDSQYITPKSKLIGAGGQMRFRFSCVRGAMYPGSTTMQFRYSRSWEHGGGKIQNVLVTFR